MNKEQIEAMRNQAIAWVKSYNPEISDAAATAFSLALATKGKAARCLKRHAPKSGSAEHAAWVAAMLNVNPFKVSGFSLLFMSPEHQAIYHEIDKAFTRVPQRVAYQIDIDRRSLTRLGVW